ncbi:P-loop containing nucleoside triphosphate hydrolase protein, partial [Thelephora terrestris]
SKASATQRAGRAGRTGPGHCYRLYSSAVSENYFDEFSKPEILPMPIDGVVLQMKSMHIDAVVNFPFPTPPSRDMLLKSEKFLTHLGALQKTGTGEAQLTDLARSMALFPLSLRYSRMLISGMPPVCHCHRLGAFAWVTLLTRGSTQR